MMKIAVVGSINTDLLYRVHKAPLKGETVFGEDYQILNGGKGSNQCVLLSALEKDVKFLGAVGRDVFGMKSLEYLATLGLDQDVLVKETNTGLAVIQLSEKDNAITVMKGANEEITIDDVNLFFNNNPGIELLLCQLEVRLETILYALEKAKEKGIQIILNPAPAHKLDGNIIEKVDYLIPNEIEAQLMFETDNLEDIVEHYKGKVIITLGDKGVMYFDEGIVKIEPAQKIEVVDTTGAGDSFIAGFTSGIANNLRVKEAIQKGIKIASITCQHMGAQSAYKKIKDTKE